MHSFTIFALAGAFLGQDAFANQVQAMPTMDNLEFPTTQAESFAEVGTMDRLQCGEPFKRFANAQPDFAKLLEAEGKWTDPEFDQEQAMQDQSGYVWKRISDVFPESAGYSLWGTNGIDFDDIQQGSLGNCWTLSAMASIAEYPERLMELFANPSLNDKGVYAVNMYAMGIPVTVVVDDYIPFHQNWPTHPKFGRPDEGKGLWPVILEKAIAKYFGYYNAIVAGQPAKAVQAFTGAPGSYQSMARLSEDQLWDLALSTNDSRDMLSIATKGQQYSNGLVQGHAYAVIGAYELSDGTRLVKTANPWGRDVYKGDWSDKSPLWTEKFKEEVSHEEESDGVFFQTVAQLKSDWAGLWLSKDIQGWQHSYWLNLGRDISTPGAPQWWCKEDNCRANTWTVTSSTDQKVHIGILRQADRSYRNCSNVKRTKMYCFAEGQAYYNHLQEGKWYEYSMTAGQTVKLQAEWDMMTGDLVNEYSVVAWAQTEAVEIVHGAGAESDSYPHQESLGSGAKTAEEDIAQQEADKKAAEEEAARQAEEEAAQKEAEEKAAAEEEAARKVKEEAERQRKLAAEKEQQAKDELARQEEEARKAKEAEDKAAAEEEAARKRKEEAARKAEEDAAQKEAEEKAAAEEEAARKAKEEAERQRKIAADKEQKAKEELARQQEEARKAKEAEEARKAEEEAARKRKEEAARKAKEAEEAARKAREEAEKSENLEDDFDSIVADIHINKQYERCRDIQFGSVFVGQREVKHFGHLCETRDALVQVNFPKECYDDKLLTITSQHQENAECVDNNSRSTTCMFTISAGEENALGMLISDRNCPLSIRRWFVEKSPAEESSDEIDENGEKYAQRLSANCYRPTQIKRRNLLMVGTNCPTKYVKGSIIMKPETWMSADIVSHFDNFDSCEPYQSGRYWQCFYKIMPGAENAFYLEFHSGISTYAYRKFKLVDME